MAHVDYTSDTFTEDFWREAIEASSSVDAAPAVQEGRLARFFHSLAASMALQERHALSPYRRQTFMEPTDILAQNYPHLYLRVMCG